MTKKITSTAKWKRHSKQRQRDEMRKAQARNSNASRSVPKKRIPKTRTRTEVLIMPPTFSIVHNPEGTVRFLVDFEKQAERTNIRLELSGITSITIDAITALLACIHRARGTTAVSGNLPNDHYCQNILIQSGFFSHVRHLRPLPSTDYGKISRRESKQVEPKQAQELVHLGTAGIYGEARRCQAAYRVLIESMSNTTNHAARSEFERETWFSTVYADIGNKRVCYAFLDTGVGIFRSIHLGVVREAYKLIGLRNDAEILREILEGKVQSRTGLKYRGKGLPAINDLVNRNRIRSLVIVANAVYANVSAGDFRMLDTHFNGTLLYWEV